MLRGKYSRLYADWSGLAHSRQDWWRDVAAVWRNGNTRFTRWRYQKYFYASYVYSDIILFVYNNCQMLITNVQSFLFEFPQFRCLVDKLKMFYKLSLLFFKLTGAQQAACCWLGGCRRGQALAAGCSRGQERGEVEARAFANGAEDWRRRVGGHGEGVVGEANGGSQVALVGCDGGVDRRGDE